MGYSVNDLKNFGESLNRSLEERSQQKADELVSRLMGKSKKAKNVQKEKTNQAQSHKIGKGWGSSGW